LPPDKTRPIQSKFIPIAYIVESTKNQKDKPCQTDLPLFKNNIKEK
jgi:hypothetical protein